jgi:hypothetical protein
MLISETHFTEKSYLKLPSHTVYHMNHPAGTVRGGTAIIIKNSIKHHQLNNYSQDFLQATSVSVEDSVDLLTILAVYLPPKHTVKQEQLEEYYITLWCQSIAGGDYNAKHTNWEFKLITPRGGEVINTMERNNLKHLFTGCVTKGIPQDFAVAKSCFDLSSDHSPVLITLEAHALSQEIQPRLNNRYTNWNYFRQLINKRLTLKVSLKTKEDIEAAVKFFNDTIQWANCNATPEHTDTVKTYDCPVLIKQKIEKKKKKKMTP